MIAKKVRIIKKYCCDDISSIENYDEAVADQTQVWECHHRLEIQGPFRNSIKLLKRCGMYWNVPASQLIFLPLSEHRSLHRSGQPLPDYWKLEISHAKKGVRFSDEHRRKISDGMRRAWARKRESEPC